MVKERSLLLIEEGFLIWREYESWKKYKHLSSKKETEVYVYTSLNQIINEFLSEYSSLNLTSKKRKKHQKSMRKKAKSELNRSIDLLDRIGSNEGLLKIANTSSQFWAYTKDKDFKKYMERAWQLHQMNYKFK